MKLSHLIVLSLCIAGGSAYIKKKSKPKGYRNMRHFNVTTMRPKVQELTLNFCNNMMASKIEPSISPKGDKAVLPWWYDHCDRLQKQEHVDKLKRLFKPLHDQVPRLKHKSDQKIFTDYLLYITKNLEEYSKKRRFDMKW